MTTCLFPKGMARGVQAMITPWPFCGEAQGVSNDDLLAHPTRKNQRRASSDNPRTLSKGKGEGRACGDDPLAFLDGRAMGGQAVTTL